MEWLFLLLGYAFSFLTYAWFIRAAREYGKAPGLVTKILFLSTPGLLVFLVWYLRNRVKDRKLAKVLNFRPVPSPTSGLYRSAQPASVSPLAFARILRRRKIHTIIDLRTDTERTDSDGHYRELPGAARVAIPFLTEIRPEWENPTDQSPEAVARRYLEMTESSGDALRQIAEVLVQPDSGRVLLRCAAGRDRTGIVVALLRAALGHEAEAIAEDYALTGVRGGTPAHAETMQEFLRLIEARPGGLAGFLEALGVDDELQARWREGART